MNDIKEILNETSGLYNDAQTTLENVLVLHENVSKIVNEKLPDVDNKILDNKNEINNHINDKDNPHSVTKAQVGLSNVDNTSDLNKPISTATQNALNGKQNTLTFDNTPISNSNNPVTSGGLYDVITNAEEGIETNATNLTNHINNKNNPHSVTKSQIGLGNVDNTSDLDKPISTATQSALDEKLNTSNVVQSTGASTLDVMSQKAVTDELNLKANASDLELKANASEVIKKELLFQGSLYGTNTINITEDISQFNLLMCEVYFNNGQTSITCFLSNNGSNEFKGGAVASYSDSSMGQVHIKCTNAGVVSIERIGYVSVSGVANATLSWNDRRTAPSASFYYIKNIWGVNL